MKVLINNEEYVVPKEEELVLLRTIQKSMLAEYEKLDEKWRFMGKPVSREVLRQMENKTRAAHGNEKALLLRPAKGQDPTIHLSNIMLGILQEALKHVTLYVSTTDHSIASFSLSIKGKSPDGRQVDTHGNIRVGQDDCSEVS